MRLVVQRVSSASVEVENKIISKIDQGLLVLLGIHRSDTAASISWLVNKLVHLRIFSDSEEKMNLSVKDVGGGILVVSQFTLYADCAGGRRPDFLAAAKGEHAEQLYEEFLQCLREQHRETQAGLFGAMMKVGLCNDGPVTVIIEKE